MIDAEQEQEQTTIYSTINNEANIDPIIGYSEVPLLPLAKACAPLVNIIYNILFYVQLAIHKTLYSMLNYTLKTGDRKDLQPYFRYLKLFLTAVAKLPCISSRTVWRGVTKDLSANFTPDASVTWWGFSSCTSTMTVLASSTYLGNTGPRTLFSIEAINGRTIRAHSDFVSEDEILLLPGTHMIVQSKLKPAVDLHIIHLKQVIPNETLLELPFKGNFIVFNI